MKPIPQKTTPYSVLIIAEQVMIENTPKQPLTESDLEAFYTKLKTLLLEYGFTPEMYGEKEPMLNRLNKKQNDNT